MQYLKIGNYSLEEELGSGSSGVVWRAIHIPTRTNVAVKVLSKSKMHDETSIIRFQRELSLMRQMSTKGLIAELYEVLENECYIFLVMEFIEKGNFLDYVNRKGRLDETDARMFFAQMIYAVHVLHKNNIIHRDLKCENILVDINENIRLIDFGLSNQSQSQSNNLFQTACGSPAYASPEMIKGEQYTYKSDVWSAGIVLYAIAVGYLPYDDDNVQKQLQKIIYSDVQYPAHMSDNLVDLLTKMLEKDPKKRISVEEIFSHKWLETVDIKTIADICDGPVSRIDPNNLDYNILKKMSEMGIETSKLVDYFRENEFNDITATYRILHRIQLKEYMRTNLQSCKILNINNTPINPFVQTYTTLNGKNKTFYQQKPEGLVPLVSRRTDLAPKKFDFKPMMMQNTKFMPVSGKPQHLATPSNAILKPNQLLPVRRHSISYRKPPG